jgi:hypothetical protein
MRVRLATACAFAMISCARSGKPQPPTPPDNRPPPLAPAPVSPATGGSVRDTAPVGLPQDVLDGTPGEREQLKQAVWRTPLGYMFRNYIFGSATPARSVEIAHSIVDRIFQNTALILTRSSAVQLMIEDIYEQGLVDKTVDDRIGLLESSVDFKRNALDVQTTRALLKQLPVFVLIGLMGGSKEVRDQVTALGTISYRRLPRFIRRTIGEEEATRDLAKFDLRRLASRRFFVQYSPFKAFSVFLHAFGGYAILFYQMYNGAANTATIQEKIWIYGLQNQIDLRNL